MTLPDTPEELDALIAAAEARKAELAKEPDWESALDVFFSEVSSFCNIGRNEAKRGLIAALPLAPVAEPLPDHMTEADFEPPVPFDVEALAREVAQMCPSWGDPIDVAWIAILETLRRRPWPSDAELQEMAQSIGRRWSIPETAYHHAHYAAILMARRLKAWGEKQ